MQRANRNRPALQRAIINAAGELRLSPAVMLVGVAAQTVAASGMCGAYLAPGPTSSATRRREYSKLGRNRRGSSYRRGDISVALTPEQYSSWPEADALNHQRQQHHQSLAALIAVMARRRRNQRPSHAIEMARRRGAIVTLCGVAQCHLRPVREAAKYL